MSEDLISYVLRYGGMCRDCADMDGVCQSGMPCDTDQRKAVVQHTISALTYGIKNGFIANPFGISDVGQNCGHPYLHDTVDECSAAGTNCICGKRTKPRAALEAKP